MDGKMEGRMSSWYDDIHEVNHRCFITDVAEGLRGCATQETAGLGGTLLSERLRLLTLCDFIIDVV